MKKLLVFLAAVIILSAVPVFAAGTQIPGVVATINGEKITKDELVSNAVTWDAPMILERMIMYKVVEQEAKKAGVTVTTKDVDAKFAELRKNLPPGQDFNDVLKRNGMTPQAAAAYMKMNLQAEGIIRKQIKVTPDALAGFTRASHILIRVPNTTDPKEKDKAEADAKAKIEKIAAEIKGGLAFEEAAKKYSEDPMTKDKGGDLDFFAKGQMVPEFEKALETMKAGQVSDPVKTSYGYHLIKFVMNGKDAAGADRKKLEDQINQREMGTKFQEFMMTARNKAKIVNFLEPAKTAPKAVAPVKAAPKTAPKPTTAAPVEAPPAPPAAPAQ